MRRICAAETDRTSAIAESIASDKDLTRKLLKSAGVPVPEGRPVTDVEDAWRAAQELGGPVVVKPLDGNHGRGVATNLTTKEQVTAAYEVAINESSRVIVERYITGDDYRLLVVGNQLVAAAWREPANVIGDGHSTIRELVDEVNRDPRRSDGHGSVLSFIKIDATSLAVLAEQGYAPDSVPPAGVKVLIRRNANLSTGGTATDVTEMVHPEIARRAVDAVRMVGLDIAGLDVVAKDISRPLREQGGAVIEINAGPGLRMHLAPSKGTPRPVGRAIVDMMFPESQSSRIPIVAVTGVNGKTTTTRLLAHIVASTGKKVGMACTDGVYFAGERIDDGDCSGPQSARSILMNPQVECAVLETARGGILREGLGFDRCDIAVVTNIGEGDHLGPVRYSNARAALESQTGDCRGDGADGRRGAERRRSARRRHGEVLPRQNGFLRQERQPSADCTTTKRRRSRRVHPRQRGCPGRRRVRIHAAHARSHPADLWRPDQRSKSKTCWPPRPLAGPLVCRPNRFGWAWNRSRHKWTKCRLDSTCSRLPARR